MFGLIIPVTAFAVLVFGMVLLAVADIRTKEVDPWSTAALAFAAVVALFSDGVTVSQWTSGLISAVLVFILYLEMGMRGKMGGGDVKLSPLPALVLGTISPFLALWAVALAFSLQATLQFAVRPQSSFAAPVALPHVPAICVATTVSAAAVLMILTA